MSWPNTLLHGRGAAVGLAFYNVLGAIGGFVSPYIVGCLSNRGSYNSSMYLQGALTLAAALMVLGQQGLLAPCMRQCCRDSEGLDMQHTCELHPSMCMPACSNTL